MNIHLDETNRIAVHRKNDTNGDFCASKDETNGVLCIDNEMNMGLLCVGNRWLGNGETVGGRGRRRDKSQADRSTRPLLR